MTGLLARRDKTQRVKRRRGMSLLEVMIATAIVLGSVMALSRLAFLARMNAVRAEDRSLAQIHCQNIMEEMLAGARPLQRVAPMAFEGENWVYMVDVEPVDQAQLARVAVTVARLEDPEAMLPNEDEMGGYRLVRWTRLGGRTLDMTELDGEQGLDNFDEFDSGFDSSDPLDFPNGEF